MSWFTSIAVYLTIWWTVLFAVLPLGVQSHADEGTEPFPGADPGAPTNPNIKRKFITTSWVSAIVLVVVIAIIELRLIKLPNLPSV